MAKINIDFNNKTYEIDESALAKAAASLSSHLSTVMNGSGATINLNGVTYNVDSSKLTTATNAFVSHLGTVSGTGSKVVVNGVEYTVDATKMTKATADLQAVLGDLVSGGNAGGDSSQEVIFPEQTLTGFVENNLSFFSVSLEPAPFTLTDGMAYRVAWDGEVYDVTAVYSSDWEITYIGDGSLLGLPGNGEPFVIVDQGDLIEVHSTTDASQSHTVAIYKAMSDNGDSDAPVQSEYGLYFGEKYSASIEDDFGGVKASYIFYEDGSMDVLAVSEYAEGIVRYEPYKLWIDETEATISSDGAQVIFGDATFTLESNSGATQSEYGIYFGEKYNGVVDGNNTAYIFYEDGRFDTITTMKFEAGACTYEPYKVLMGGEVFGTVSPDGTQFSSADGVFTLEADIDVPTTGNSITWRTTDVEGREIAYADDGTPVLIKISDLAPTVAELEGAVLSAIDNNTGATETYILSATNGTIADYGSVTALMDNMVIVAYSDGSIIDDDLSIPTKGIWVQLQLTLMDMTVTLTLGNNSDAPETGAHGLYFGKKYNGYMGDNDSVSILMSMSFGADGSNVVYSGDGNILANNPAGSATYEGNAICLNGEPWYIVSEDGVMLITPDTNTVAYVLDPSVGVTSAVVPDGVTRIGDTNEAPFAYYDILTSITIPASVTSIGGYAFYGCTSLTTITFEGTMAQWNAITFGGADWNYNVPATTVTCSDGTVTI